MSHVVQQEALTKLLVEKGIFTKEELLEEDRSGNYALKGLVSFSNSIKRRLNEMDGERIENILEKSWGEFKKYYNEKVNIYINSPIYNEWKKKIIEGRKRKPAKKDEDEHWICWNEYDLMVHIGRFFYNQI
jgi:hypothetical protein